MLTNPLALLLLLTLASTTTAAAELAEFWNQHGVSLLAEESLNFSRLRTESGQEFYLKDIESIEPLQGERLLELIPLFYGWQQIKISRLQFAADTETIRVVVTPSAVEYQQKEYLPHISAGLLFSDDGDRLSYNFRVIDNDLFLRIQGTYLNEGDLLEKIASVLSAGEQHIAKESPNYLVEKTKELEETINALPDYP